MDALKVEYYRGHRIEIHSDLFPMNPREWDNFGTMVCFHKRYDLGDKDNGFGSPEDLFIHLKKQKSFYLNLYLYDHSGITIKTSPFSCPWDSGQVGIIFIDPEKARKEFRIKRINKKIKAKVFSLMEAEVKEYDSYLSGQYYGYIILDKNGENINSCWNHDEIDFALSEAKSQIDSYVAIKPEKFRAIMKLERKEGDVKRCMK